MSAVPASRSSKRQLEGEIICTCGTCGRWRIGECTAELAAEHAAQTREDAAVPDEGKDHDEVIAAFIQEFGGQESCSSPVDKGFNRLAWLFPYLIGATGAASDRDSRRSSGRACRRAPRRRDRAAPRAAPIPICSRDWTMSSATSIKRAPSRPRRLSLAVPTPRPRRGQDAGFRPWHFFVLASLVAATVAVIMSRQSAPEHLILHQPDDWRRRWRGGRGSTACSRR